MPLHAACPAVNPCFAWNHGDDNPEIARTWVGYVGPTVKNLGETRSIWTDHADVRSTMLETLGLADDYMDDGNGGHTDPRPEQPVRDSPARTWTPTSSSPRPRSS